MDYVKELDKNILKAEGVLCGLILKQPDTLLDYTINYKILSDNALFYTGIVNKLLERGVNVVDEVSFVNEVQTLELTDKYETLGGYKTIKELMDIVDIHNADAIVENFTKWNLVKKYKEKGILDIEKLWSKISLMTSGQIVDFIEYQLNDNDLETSSDIDFEKLSYSDNELQELQDGVNIGLQYNKHSPLLNYLTLGVAKSNLYLFGGYTNSGKSSFIFENMVLAIAENGHKCCVISNEQKSDAFKILLQIHVLTQRLDYWNITRKKIKSGDFSNEDDLRMMKKARDIIKEEYDPYITFVKLYDYDTSKVNKIVKKLSKVGTELFFYDTFKLGDNGDGSAWEKILADSKNLFQIASKNDVAIIMSVQLALHSKNKVRWLDEGVLSNGKQMAETVETGVYMRDLWADELEGENYDIRPYTFEKDENGKYTKIKKEIVLDKSKKYKLFFLSKCRADENGQVLVYEFLGAYNRWKEISRCTPYTKNLY